MMFDAAAMVAQDVVLAGAADAARDAIVPSGPEPFPAVHGFDDARPPAVPEHAIAPSGDAPRPVIFIDMSVADHRELAAVWADRGEVVLIDGRADGVDQMRAALAGRSDVREIHIVGHGAAGELRLGTTRIDQEAIAGDLRASFGAIGRALGPDGDILIYGCDFGQGEAGAAAMGALARATGADVAASVDTTGHAARGGDWTLEATSGAVEAQALDGGEWAHTLDPNDPVPIGVTADSLTVTNGSGVVVTAGATGYGADARSPDVGVGATATWTGAAILNGRSVDLKATVVSISAGDAVRFNRPTGTGANGDDPTFLLRDLTAGATPATVELRWELVDGATGEPLPADVRFTIADIDGIDGAPASRESVTASTQGLAYFTRERASNIHFTSSLDAITASGTQNENQTAGAPVSPGSAATFDWSAVSSFTLTYTLAPNSVTTQAQFYQDGDADFLYADPVYVSIPRLDLDADDGTAAGNDARFAFTEGGAGVPVVDADVIVANPMDIESVQGATIVLTNAKPGDALTVGALPMGISATVTEANGAITVTLVGQGGESDYEAALRAVRYSNGSDAPDTTQRVIEVRFSNDTLTSALAVSRVDVIAVQDAPVAVADTATVVEDGVVTIPVLANDRDPDGDPLTVTAASALDGAVVRNADGTLTYRPNADRHGSDTITYTISDGQGGAATATVAVTVTPVNDAPGVVGAPPARSADDGQAVSIATAPGFADRDGDALAYSVSGLPAGLSIDAATGVISGVIDRSASQANGGVHAVVVTVRDPSGATAQQGFTLTVTNPGPVAADDTAATDEDVSVVIDALLNDGDPDGDPLTVTGADALHGAVAVNADGALTYTPGADFNGSDTITYTVSDGQGGVAAATIAVTVRPANDAPAGTGALPARSAADGQTVSIVTAAAFADRDGDALSHSAAGLPAGLSIEAATGVISGAVDRSASQANGGVHAVTVTARDPSGATAQRSFTLTIVNPGPSAAGDTAVTDEDTPVRVAVLANDADPDADPLTVTDASALHGAVVVNGDGTLTYTPAAEYSGADTITYTVSDGEGGVATATAAVTVDAVDDAPLAAAPLPPRSGVDGEAVSFGTASGFSDPEGGGLRYSATGLPAGLTIDAATGTVSGVIDRAGSQPGGGAYMVVVTVRDAAGGTATQRFAYAVANPGPTAADDVAATDEDALVAIDVLRNDADADGDPLTVVDATAGHGTAVVDGVGMIAYTPDADWNGVDTIRYRIADGQGGFAAASVTVTVAPVNDAPRASPIPTDHLAHNGARVDIDAAQAFADPEGDALTYAATGLPAGLTIDAATGRITGVVDRSASQIDGGLYVVAVTARDPSGATAVQSLAFQVSDPVPVASDDDAATRPGRPVTISVLANDSDPDGDALSVVTATAANGTVTVDADGTLAYAPAAGFTGLDTIAYTIRDADGATATARVTVEVRNAAPVADPLTAQSAEDGAPVRLDLGAAFRDLDGDALRFSAIGLPPGLSIDPATGIVSGTVHPSASQMNGGVYETVVTVDDGFGGVTSAALRWTVANPAPVAGDDAVSTAEDQPVQVAVLPDDIDPDGDPLTVVEAVAGHGRVTIGADGALTYTPAPDFAGEDVIAYTVSDGQGGRSTARVTVTVAAAEDAPIAQVLRPLRSADAQTVALELGGFFSDADGHALGFSATGLPPGLTIDPATGRVSGVLDASASRGGVHRVVVTATDPSGRAASSAFDWTIVNPAPVAADDAASTQEDAPVRIAVLPNDADPDGDRLGVVGATASHGRVVVEADGALTYTPDPDFAGEDVIVYTVEDADGARATASVLVTVAPVPDAPDAAPTARPRRELDGAPVSIATGGLFADRDGDPLVFTGEGLPAGLSIDPATGLIAGVLGRSASQAAGGVHPITVTARDPSGATAGVRFDLIVANPPPVAADDDARTDEDTPVTIPVLGDDRDPDGDPLRVTDATAGAGTVTINPDGTLGYRPGPNFAGVDTIRYTISDGEGGVATAIVTVVVDPVNDVPLVPGQDPIDGVGGRPVLIRPVVTDPDGDPVVITGADSPAGTVRIDPDGTLAFTPRLGFVGDAVIRFTVSDGRGGFTTGEIPVRVADGRGADVEQLLRIGQVRFLDPAPRAAVLTLTDGEARNPLAILSAVEGVRSLRSTEIGVNPVGDAVEAIRTLRSTTIDPEHPVTAEVVRLDDLRDGRDAGDRLFDARWGDFFVKGLTGFSAAADRDACVMVESVVRGGAIYLEVRDIAEDGRAPVRSVDVRLADGGKADWIRVDPRGLAIIERGADLDELRLVVRVTRADGRTSSTPIVVQGATGEVELDRPNIRRAAQPLDDLLATPDTAADAEAARISRSFR